MEGKFECARHFPNVVGEETATPRASDETVQTGLVRAVDIIHNAGHDVVRSPTRLRSIPSLYSQPKGGHQTRRMTLLRRRRLGKSPWTINLLMSTGSHTAHTLCGDRDRTCHVLCYCISTRILESCLLLVSPQFCWQSLLTILPVYISSSWSVIQHLYTSVRPSVYRPSGTIHRFFHL